MGQVLTQENHSLEGRIEELSASPENVRSRDSPF